MKFPFSIFFFIVFVSFLSATIINIQADQPTIQAGINISVDEDTVLVQLGTYFENINYNGKNITVASLFLTTQNTTYISQTIIDGDSNYSVIFFTNGEDSTAVLVGFTITNGQAMYGGGISCWNSCPSLQNLYIMDNSGFLGGGIWCYDDSYPNLVNVTIIGNSAYYSGGGFFCQNSSISLENVTISNNSADLDGGGIVCFFNSNASLVNVTISGNYASSSGGISCSYNSSLSLENVTISDNSAESGGGIWCRNNSDPDLVNCILWNNSPEEIYFCEDENPNTITISYSDIEGGEAGIVTNNNGTVYWLEGNIDEDPLFVGTGGYPYSLLEDSPCIDAGNPDPIYYDPEDPNNTGYALYPAMGTIINDMGAYGGPNVIGWPVVELDDNVIIQTPEVLLHQNYPNPFNPTTTISFSVAQTLSFVILDIYNIKGQLVKILIDEKLPAGNHQVTWNGKDDNGKHVASGIYFYKMKTVNFEKTKKMLLLK
jgi:hypothetical protein